MVHFPKLERRGGAEQNWLLFRPSIALTHAFRRRQESPIGKRRICRPSPLSSKRRAAEAKKSKYLKEAGGLKYTALAMANRADSGGVGSEF